MIRRCENLGFLPHMLAGILLGDDHFGTSESAILAKEMTAITQMTHSPAKQEVVK